MSLDISGNAIGNKGAFMLAKALQVNQSLKRLWLDDNQITSAGRENESERKKKKKREHLRIFSSSLLISLFSYLLFFFLSSYHLSYNVSDIVYCFVFSASDIFLMKVFPLGSNS